MISPIRDHCPPVYSWFVASIAALAGACEGRAQSQFAPGITLTGVLADRRFSETVDLNGDGALDVLAGVSSLTQFRIFLNDGSGRFRDVSVPTPSAWLYSSGLPEWMVAGGVRASDVREE